MNSENKQRLKEFLVKYPKVKDCIIKGDYDLLWRCFGFAGYANIPRKNPLGDGNGKFEGYHRPNPLYGCLIMNALAELEIDCQLKKIPWYYANCTECVNLLDEIIIPKGVEIIEEYAFSDCDNVKVINIPDSVREIGENAFLLGSLNTNISLTVTIPERFKGQLSIIGLSPSYDDITFI